MTATDDDTQKVPTGRDAVDRLRSQGALDGLFEQIDVGQVKMTGADGLLGSGQYCVVGGVPGVPPGRLLPGRRTWPPGQGPAAPTPPPSGSAAPWAQPGRSCPASTPGGSRCRRSAARVPPAAWASTPPARGPGAGPPSHGILPGPRRPCRTGPQTRSAYGTRSPRAWL